MKATIYQLVQPPYPWTTKTQNTHQKISLCVTIDELGWLLTVYELAFLLFRVKKTAQVKDDGQKEHETGHSNDRNRLLTR